MKVVGGWDVIPSLLNLLYTLTACMHNLNINIYLIQWTRARTLKISVKRLAWEVKRFFRTSGETSSIFYTFWTGCYPGLIYRKRDGETFSLTLLGHVILFFFFILAKKSRFKRDGRSFIINVLQDKAHFLQFQSFSPYSLFSPHTFGGLKISFTLTEMVRKFSRFFWAGGCSIFLQKVQNLIYYCRWI